MQQKSFDPHARILHDGQYKIRKSTLVEVPIKHFETDMILEHSVQERIQLMHAEIVELEEKIREKRKISQDKADKILEQVQDEAKKVLEEAEQHAFDRVQKSVKEKEKLLLQTSEEVERILHKAQQDGENITQKATSEGETLKEIAKKDGFDKGVLSGIEEGKQEISFAVERLHGIIAETARERERILVHSETQVINLVLTMVGKVVKKLTIEHKEIVIENVKAALELLRSAMTLFIHVSPQDFNYVSSFKEELVRMIESRADLKLIEDPTIEPGGVFIETDVGDVDATIRSQLEELENQMRFYMPVKVKSPEVKKRDQEYEKTLHNEQEEKIVRENIPNTPFAHREEYQGSTTIEPDNTKEILADDVDLKDTVLNDIVIEESPEEGVTLEHEPPQSPIADTIVHPYKENSETKNTTSSDDIVV